MNIQKQGLTTNEATAKLKQFGENKLNEQKRNTAVSMFFSQFKDIMILILAIATVISVAMGEGVEAITIIIIVIMNASMGFIQEYRTEKTLTALKELSAPVSRVRRDGTEQDIQSKLLVPDDVILLKAGDKIPADAKLYKSVQIACNESMLTGESQQVQKENGDDVYMGCIITSGHGEAMVSKTGMNTQMGNIAALIQTAEEQPTPLQIKLKQLGKFVAIFCTVVCFAVALLGFFQGGNLLNMLLTGVSLAVAAIPEGLPAIVTITLALSVNRILKHGAVIRKLHAVETLGCAGVICADKTGTITQNCMTVQIVSTPENTKAAQELLLEKAALCSTANLETKSGDATEIAILHKANEFKITKQKLDSEWEIVAEQPFNSIKKRMSVVAKNKKGIQILIVKGAADFILPLCTHINSPQGIINITITQRKAIETEIENMAKQALRIIAVATNTNSVNSENNLCFCGLIAMMDPPRKEVKAAVKTCRTAGIKPVMITGDNKDTALAVAKSVGIARAGDKAVEGYQIEKMSDSELAAQCVNTSVFARVSPVHKLRIVKAYKSLGQVTAMTGDGVNDAPAVKEADIGIAMGTTGTDVTREASSVVILDDNFATIVATVEEGRVIYQNIRRFIRFLLTSNLGEVLGMLFGMVLGLPVMLAPIQILLVNLFTDGLPAIALGMEPSDENIMKQKPRPKTQGLFANGLGLTIFVRGAMLGMASCGAYWVVLNMGGNLQIARSACFMTIVISQMLHIFECRGSKFLHFGGNKMLIAATSCSVFCTLASVYVPFLQEIFNTDAVTGVYLIPVIVAALIGPVISLIFHSVKKD